MVIFRILQAFAAKMNVKIRSKRAVEAFDEFMRGWMPLTAACFRAACHSSPSCQSFTRPERLASLSLNESHPLSEAVKACDNTGITVVFIAKILHYGESVLAMCRILSGTIKKLDKLFLIENKATMNGTVIER